MTGQVFLGGACGGTDWRRQIAIPLLERAGVTYFNPQLEIGEWTPAREVVEMEAKSAADVLLYVVAANTRGVATVAEVAHALGTRRRVSLAITDIGPDDRLYGTIPGCAERDDLNRGRVFIRTMAQKAGVPVFREVESAVRHAIQMLQGKESTLTTEDVRAVLSKVGFKDGRFLVEVSDGGFLMEFVCEEPDVATGAVQTYHGRKWHISWEATPSDIVRTAFKAVVTWQEHEARERFTYRGVPVFGPHCDVDALVHLMAGTDDSRA